MKKILVILILINFLLSPAYAFINDDFAENSLNKSLKIKQNSKVVIEDDFVSRTLDKNLKIETKQSVLLRDDNIAKNKNLKIVTNKKIVYEENNLPKISSTKNINSVNSKTKIDISKEIPVTVSIKSNFSTKLKPEEGYFLDFVTTKDFTYKGKDIPKGTTIVGRIEVVSQNAIMGVPADLVVGNFKLNDIDLSGEIKITGANRSIWVYPLFYVGCFFFGAGLLAIPIRGGHAKISTEKTYTLYAY